jgi:cytochrome d ubiquinol oxidase subunit II
MDFSWLTLIWAVLLAVAVFMYVLMDGFDLGVGLLYPFAKSEQDRDVMMNTVAPVWDGNETWLILGGGGLLATFPLAYAALMPAIYWPITLMLLGLIFRGVAFEFRFKATKTKALWGAAFTVGSAVAAFSQGLVLGLFVEGLVIDQEGFAVGGPLAWLSPYAFAIGFGVMAGYALLGSTWLIWKTEGELQDKCRDWAKISLIAVLFFMGFVSLAMPFVNEVVRERWFTFPNIALLAPVPVLTAGLALYLFVSVRKGAEVIPFLSSLGLFLLGYIGLAISIFPYVAPRPGGGEPLTVWETAAPPEAQIFMLIGALITLPAIFAYTGYVYWTFRGKVRAGEGYGH